MRKINPHDFHFFDRFAKVSNRIIVPKLIRGSQLFSYTDSARRVNQGIIAGLLNELIAEGFNSSNTTG